MHSKHVSASATNATEKHDDVFETRICVSN